MPVFDMNQIQNIAFQLKVKEPEYTEVEAEEEGKREYALKASATADTIKYDDSINKHIFFKKTLMFTQRVHKFSISNTSKIQMKYACKIVAADTGV